MQLPPAFRHHPGEYPVVIYWAYNNELNKDIGLDLTPYLGRAVEVRLYKTTELLPEFMEPRREAGRAVVVRYQGQLIGAWLDAGRHYSFACSLKGRRLEEVTGQGWDEWVAGLIDPRDPAEQELARLTPEEVIRGYYEAVNRGDYTKAHAYESRRALTQYLFNNMDNNLLFNPGYRDSDLDGLANITAARVLSIGKPAYTDAGSPRETRIYPVKVELKVRHAVTYNSGPQVRFLTLRRETSATGWRIESIGTGP